MYPQKFLNETWNELQQTKLAKALYEDGQLVDMAAHNHFGLYMMVTLAVACARGRRRLITDRVDSYRSLYNLLADADASSEKRTPSSHTQVLTAKFKGFDFAGISLRRLVNLRKREDSLLAELRRKFLDELDKSAAELSEHASDERDVDDIVGGFTAKMESDLRELKRALRRNVATTLLSKEFGVAVAALALQPVEPVANSLLSTGALTRTLMSYQDKRRDLLKKHASAWLYASGPGRWLY